MCGRKGVCVYLCPRKGAWVCVCKCVEGRVCVCVFVCVWLESEKVGEIFVRVHEKHTK